MRLFSGSTPRSSPELVRHSLVSPNPTDAEAGVASADGRSKSESADHRDDCKTPPREHSPALVRGVSTLGRKFSRRFEKFGESETARRLRMASPSRKYQWAITGDIATASGGGGNDGSKSPKTPPPSSSSNGEKKRVSRVDSFRNFFSLVHAPGSNASSSNHTSTLRTPRAVKRRSRNGGEKRSSRLQLVDAATSTTVEQRQYNLSAPNSLSNGLNTRFGSSSAELALIMSGGGGGNGAGDSELALSECQSEADLRYYNYCTTEEEEDDTSVVSEGFMRSTLVRNGNSKSAGNLRLGILPENRTITFQERAGIKIKDYGLIDSSNPINGGGADGEKKKAPGSQNSHESGYSSSDNNSGTSPNSSSRASPRASIDGEQENKQAAPDNAALPVATQDEPPIPRLVTTKLRNTMAAAASSVPPKKPARLSKLGLSQRSRSLEQQKDQTTPKSVNTSSQQCKSVKDYKMVRLVKGVPGDELGIIIAKKKLKEINTTGFQIVHIEPDGMVDR